eukprot:5330985-Pyramimonas_sp.AAC.1
MQRSGGEIYAEPSEGINLPCGSLMRLLVNVCGLDDPPMAWRRTVIKHIGQCVARAMLVDAV